MSVDIRAKFMCNLGPVVTGSISDNPMLEKGLVVSTGEITIQGNVQRPRGTPVDLAYMEIDEGTGQKRVTRFPRRLRILNCTADPFRNTTTFQLGDKLSLAESYFSKTDVYYAGEHRPSWWDENEYYERGWWWIDDPSKSRFCKQTIKKTYRSPYSDWEWEWEYDRIRKVVPTIEAWPLVKFICQRCDIKLNWDESYKLRFQFLQSSMRFDDGYIKVLDDLIVSEACYGFIDINERLCIRKFPLGEGVTAPVLRQEQVIDVQTISSSDNPDSQVSVGFAAKQRTKVAGKTLQAYTNQERPD